MEIAFETVVTLCKGENWRESRAVNVNMQSCSFDWTSTHLNSSLS